MKKTTILIDGGHLRSYAKLAKKTYTPQFVLDVAKKCLDQDEKLFRVIYYDCTPYTGTVKTQISGASRTFTGNDSFLNNLAEQEFVAVRKGVLKFRGWTRTPASISAHDSAARAGNPAPALTDQDFKPNFEQKGVDLRIGLDMINNNLSSNDLMILMTGDTDLIPALKIVRTKGIQVAGVNLPNYQIIPELKQHLDIYRTVTTW